MREGSLEPPVRHPIAWDDPDFYDAQKIDAEQFVYLSASEPETISISSLVITAWRVRL